MKPNARFVACLPISEWMKNEDGLDFRFWLWEKAL